MTVIKATLGGKERSLRFNQMALEVYCKNIDFENATNASAIYATFYAGLYADKYVKKEDVDFSFEEVVDWVEELYETDRKSISDVCDFFAATNTYKNWLEEFKDRLHTLTGGEEDKKKAE